MSQLPLYKCHKVVRAAKIIGITDGFNDRHTELVLDVPDPVCPKQGHLSVMVSDLWTARNPALAVGGYFVEYQDDDKYTAYSPAGPFESGYTLVKGAGQPTDLSLERAAQAWCTEITSGKEMDSDLAIAFASILDDVWSQPWLGNATTRELLAEIEARGGVDSDPDYRTVAE